MPRAKTPIIQPIPTVAPDFPPTAVYRPKQVQSALGLRQTTIAREIRCGRLRCSRRAGRIFILGQWVLAWIAEGEDRTPSTPT